MSVRRIPIPMMRVALVSEHASPLAAVGGVDAGGQNVHVAALARALGAAGHTVTVYTRRDDPSSPDTVALAPNVTVEHVPAGPARHLPKDELLPHMGEFGRWLEARWTADRPDVVHSHFWMSGLAALVATTALDLPLVHTYHALGTVKRRHQGADDTSPPQRPRFEAALGRQADRIVATCTDEVEELTRVGVRRTAIDVVPSGVDVELFADSGPSLPRGDLHRLVTVGRMVPRKGFRTAIEAMRMLPDAELLVAGGPDVRELDGDPEVRRLRDVAARLGVGDRVQFLGAVGREEMPALLRSADIVVSVPWYEPFGIVPLEAMACGKPVVASAVGGQVDTVVDGGTGVLVPPRRPDRLAAAVRGLLSDWLALEGYGLAASDRARMRYAWPRIAEETSRVYADVVALRRGLTVAALAGLPEGDDLEDLDETDDDLDDESGSDRGRARSIDLRDVSEAADAEDRS